MSATCFAHGCNTNTESTNKRFYRLTEARGSLTEWLLALNRLDILADLTIRKKARSYRICVNHFPSTRNKQPPEIITESKSNSCTSTGTQTDKSYSLTMLMITPVEIVDIQPEPLIIPGIFNNSQPPIDLSILNNISGVQSLDAQDIIAMGGLQTVQPINATSGLITNIHTMQPSLDNLEIPAVITDPKSVSHGSQPIMPTQMENSIIPGYIIKLNDLQSMLQPLVNVDIAGLGPTNLMQPSSDNTTNLVATNATSSSLDTDIVEIGSDAIQSDDIIKIEDESDTTDDDCPKSSELISNIDQNEYKSNIIQLAFDTVGQDDENAEHCVKFEIEESESEDIETYYFFEGEGTKRRKVDATDNGFEIVKLEIDSGHDDT